MRDRGVFPQARSAMLSRSALVAVTSLTGALLVAAPPGAPGTGTMVAPRVGSAVAAASPRVVAPEVSETRIPPVTAATRMTAATPSLLPHDHGTARLVSHVRVREVGDFAMLGATWSGDSAEHVFALVRTHSPSGWSDWSELHVEADEGPSATEESAARSGTEPLWVGSANGVEISVYTESGQVPRDLEVSTIDPGQSTYDATATATAATTEAASDPGPKAGTFPGMPSIVTRRAWGADPSLGDECWAPRFGTTFRNVFVHHTVTGNDYSRAESPSIVRGIYAYHTQSRGWCDIGYNFLVDRYGNTFEGRRGGIRKSVRGAHAGDYNTNSTGISLMGEFETGYPTRAMKHALVQLIAWRMGTAYHGAYGKPFIYDKRFKRISGHRDAMATSCPGIHVYEWLPKLRERVQARLGDYESKVEARWRDAGAGQSWLGAVRIGEQGAARGHYAGFQAGVIFASASGVRVLPRGAILKRHKRLGSVRGPLGYPTSGVASTGSDRGTRAVFEDGRIWWSRVGGTRAFVKGPVLAKYLDLHGANGRLGFPVRAPHGIRGGSRADFEHGYITWTRSTHKTAVTYT